MNEGQRINITFLHFDLEEEANCGYDFVELDNFSKHCGSISQPWSIISNTNTLTVTFRSNGVGRQTGFVAVWTASSEPPTYPPTPTGCDSCTFPFVFGSGSFDTCISVLDEDTQPWCSTFLSTEGTHIPPPPKISCSDSDSSCPSSPSKTVITSPDYPASYPNNADEVK